MELHDPKRIIAFSITTTCTCCIWFHTIHCIICSYVAFPVTSLLDCTSLYVCMCTNTYHAGHFLFKWAHFKNLSKLDFLLHFLGVKYPASETKMCSKMHYTNLLKVTYALAVGQVGATRLQKWTSINLYSSSTSPPPPPHPGPALVELRFA